MRKIKVRYEVTIAGRYAFKQRIATYTFSTRRPLRELLESEVAVVIQFKLRNQGLSISGLKIKSMEATPEK